jgi:hypothetical protein
MQNINYVGGAGSTTAAQFLQRFILNKTPWRKTGRNCERRGRRVKAPVRVDDKK